MYIVLQIPAWTIALLVAQEGLRRADRRIVWGIFLGGPLLLTPYWIQVNDLGLFSWFKYYTVFFCICWGTVLRFTRLGNRTWARSSIALLLSMNISEAVVVDLVAGGWAHLLNAAAGALVIAISPFGADSARIDSASPYRDLLYGVSRRWVLGYTLWNWAFVYLNYPALAGHHTAVLAAGGIVAMIDPGRWGQTRASTLGFSLLFTATCYDDMVAWMDTATWFDEQLGIVAAGFALAYTSGYAVHLGTHQPHGGRRPQRPQEIGGARSPLARPDRFSCLDRRSGKQRTQRTALRFYVFAANMVQERGPPGVARRQQVRQL